jgi:hypothetical protein
MDGDTPDNVVVKHLIEWLPIYRLVLAALIFLWLWNIDPPPSIEVVLAILTGILIPTTFLSQK